MKKILLIATGGTIASKYTEQGLSPQISANELLEYVPAAREFCTIDTEAPFSLDSTNVCAKHWAALAELIEKKYEYYDGFVICHGTDTMAYTAAALSYLIQNNRKPVVVTGAQKPIDLAITDARSNLLDSLRFASHPRAHGTVIVFGGKVIAGTRAKKVLTTLQTQISKHRLLLLIRFDCTIIPASLSIFIFLNIYQKTFGLPPYNELYYEYEESQFYTIPISGKILHQKGV